MSELPTALPYESIGTDDSASPFWRAFRFAVIAWSASVIVRHAAYYLMALNSFSGGPTAMWREGAFAFTESILAGLIFANAWMLKPSNRRQLLTLAGLCGAFIAVSLIGFLINTMLINFRVTTFPNASNFGTQLLRLFWQLIVRLQLLIVPAMALVVAARNRGSRLGS